MMRCESLRWSLQGKAGLRGTLLVTLVVIVCWLETARGNPLMCKILDRREGLSVAQHNICLREGPRLLRNVALMAKAQDFPSECQYWMADERWNCTNISMPIFPKGFQSPNHWVHKLTRETAYAQALTSGLLLHRAVQDCSSTAGCCVTLSDPLPSDEKWQPCNENVGYGIEFSKNFLDTLWTPDHHPVQQQRQEYQPSVAERLVHLHNLEAGRRAVTQNQEKRCHCHGMTSSCQVQTCTKTIPSARRIGQILKREYENAQKVEKKVVPARPGLPLELKKVNHESTDQQSPFPDNTQLVYQDDSPDYCSANSGYGATGVSGRECLLEASPYTAPKRIGLCSEVCCDAGFRTELVKVKRVCSCIIGNGCNQDCSYQVQKYFCN